MANGTLVNLAVEDELGEQMLRVLLNQSGRVFHIGTVRGKQGSGFLKKSLNAFNNAAKGTAYIVFTDLDDRPCAPFLIEEWFNCSMARYATRRHTNLLFRIAVREVESWILADRDAIAKFLGVSVQLIPAQTDLIQDPKALLLTLANKSRKRSLRDDLVPRLGDQRRVGPDYNGRLSEFLHSSWRATVAELNSSSLARARRALLSFHPLFPKS